METHKAYILRCLELAQMGTFAALPNPSVGAVIVYKNRIIGEGYTQAYGGAHAEVGAIGSVKNPEWFKDSTLYVSLEPCSHYGKTPPCADLIIQMQIPRVVIGTIDPFAQVCGRGIAKLKAAGIEVITGVLEAECRHSNRRFFVFHQKKRPYIILKWAESVDGFIAPAQREQTQPVWLTHAYSRQLVHKWRSEETAFLVGAQTVIDDNPSLTTRDWYGKDPVRIYIDRDGSIPATSTVKDGTVKTICITANSNLVSSENHHYEVVNFAQSLPEQICCVLYRHQLCSLVVEGGAQTLQSFIDAELWDEARVFKSELPLKQGTPKPTIRYDNATVTTLLDNQLWLIHP
ncbi:bifunctional diaminohydroxyphosphoribosylaminopyrimidine deaminase/5-amino-6-(5-phosphoribosylamino)uracil reductase RibD [Flavobacterium sp. JP2137]|uniref:bifunctional diaminohydroxyphosphoribosylaminopyrimidine deaminase/5-amino-6-(5-phosphoribosylamino)uracil reductase RibD n=1 Tax=Flavobacterium sp. JP2137 TaxID=3414510 RepID=UPI003D30061B